MCRRKFCDKLKTPLVAENIHHNYNQIILQTNGLQILFFFRDKYLDEDGTLGHVTCMVSSNVYVSTLLWHCIRGHGPFSKPTMSVWKTNVVMNPRGSICQEFLGN